MSLNRLTAVHARPDRSAWFAALGATLALLGVLVTQWPAAWLASAVQHFSGGRVLLLESRGTLWQGSAHLALSAGGGSTPSAWAQRLHWQVSLTELNALQIQWSTPGQSQAPWVWKAQWQPSGLAFSLGDVDWQLPTTWLSGWGAPWNTVQPEGVLQIQSRQWTWRQTPQQWRADGQITLSLLGLSTRLSSLRPLGDYQLVLHGGESPRLALDTLSGPLRLSGEGRWQQGRIQFLGQAWAQEPSDEIVLSNLLSVLGVRHGPRAILKVG